MPEKPQDLSLLDLADEVAVRAALADRARARVANSYADLISFINQQDKAEAELINFINKEMEDRAKGNAQSNTLIQDLDVVLPNSEPLPTYTRTLDFEFLSKPVPKPQPRTLAFEILPKPEPKPQPQPHQRLPLRKLDHLFTTPPRQPNEDVLYIRPPRDKRLREALQRLAKGG